MESIYWLSIFVGSLGALALGFLLFHRKKSAIRGEKITKAVRDVDDQKDLKVHPNKYFEMGPKTRQDIFNATHMLKTDPTKVKMSSMEKSLSLAERTKLVTSIREALKRLETQDFSSRLEYQKTIDNAEDLLFAVYEAGISRVSFTHEEQFEFWPLVQKALPAIGSRVRYIVSDFPPGSLQSSKIERSGLQFLFDNFEDFAISNNNQDLKDFREEEDVDEWNDCLNRIVVDDLDPGVGVPQPSTPDVPSTHWWFFQEENTSTVNNKSDDPDEVHWKTEAKKRQQYIYNHLGDREWDKIEKGKLTFFRQKVGYGVYGPPSKEPTKENNFTGYEDNQLDIIENICTKLHEINEGVSQEDIMFSCIFVIGKILNDNFIIPVFRTRKMTNESSTFFVDTVCQVYSSWSDYLKYNTLPKCTYCYPRDGHYIADDSGNVITDFGTSPASYKVHEIFFSVSKTSAADVTMGATPVVLGSYCSFPHSGPITAWGIEPSNSKYPSSADLSDCELYNEKIISIRHNIVDCSLGDAQAVLLSTIPIYTCESRVPVIDLAVKIALAVVKSQGLSSSDILIIGGMAALVDKRKQNELTKLDVFKFTASCLFFTNTAIDLNTCLAIIEHGHHYLFGEQSDIRIPVVKLFSNFCGPCKWYRSTKRIETVKQHNDITERYNIMVHPDIDNEEVKQYQDVFKELIVSRGLKLPVPVHHKTRNWSCIPLRILENRIYRPPSSWNAS